RKALKGHLQRLLYRIEQFPSDLTDDELGTLREWEDLLKRTRDESCWRCSAPADLLSHPTCPACKWPLCPECGAGQAGCECIRCWSCGSKDGYGVFCPVCHYYGCLRCG